jgi:hypothetical protein
MLGHARMAAGTSSESGMNFEANNRKSAKRP